MRVLKWSFFYCACFSIMITCSCTRIKSYQPIKIKLTTDRPLVKNPNINMPGYIIELAKLIEIEDTIYQPELFIYRNDLDEQMKKVEVERKLLNDFRLSMGIYNSKNLLDDYTNLDKIHPTEYFSKPGKNKNPSVTIPDNALYFSILSGCIDSDGANLRIEEVIDIISMNIQENKCKSPVDTIKIQLVFEPSLGPKQVDNRKCSEAFNHLVRYFESSPTITIPDKIHDLKRLTEDQANQNDYCIYLEIATYLNHIGGLNKNETQLNESLDYLAMAKKIAANQNHLSNFRDDLDDRISSGFFKDNYWSNSTMRIRFENIK